MKRFLMVGVLSVLVVIGWIFASQVGQTAQARPMNQISSRPETWTLGITLEGDPAYLNVAGRLVSDTASFRANREFQDIYFVFPASANQKTITGAQFYLLSRAGDFDQAVILTLEVLSFDGTLQSIVSVNPDIRPAAVGEWIPLTISQQNISDLVIDPGEFLAFHLHFDRAPQTSDTFEIRPIFEVQVQ